MNVHRNLWLCSLTPDQHAKTCGYWYTVTSNGHMAHTAFARRESLMQWLAVRDLSLSEPLPEHGTHSCQKIIGQYATEMHSDYNEVLGRLGYETRVMSNGDYTVGVIDDQDGIKCVHYLNPNCARRPVFNHSECRAIYG